jgi:hypothetical protein
LQYIYADIKTPTFVLNSMYDIAHLKNIFGLPCLPGNCTEEMLVHFERFHEVFVEKIAPVLSTSNGYYFDSCLVHCQTLTDDAWQLYRVMGHTVRETFADWYYEGRRPVNASWQADTSPWQAEYGTVNATRIKDCNYPCNQSCP